MGRPMLSLRVKDLTQSLHLNIFVFLLKKSRTRANTKETQNSQVKYQVFTD